MQPTRKENNELVQAIIGGEMRNAWQPTAPGEGKDERHEKARWTERSQAFYRNYDAIDWRQ